MNAGDIVQVRQRDLVDHWIYAKVLDPASRLVQIEHPENREHGVQKIVAAADIRTKADVRALLTTVQGMTGTTLSNSQLNTLAAADPFFARFKRPEMATQRDGLHKHLVDHYDVQISRLT